MTLEDEDDCRKQRSQSNAPTHVRIALHCQVILFAIMFNPLSFLQLVWRSNLCYPGLWRRVLHFQCKCRAQFQTRCPSDDPDQCHAAQHHGQNMVVDKGFDRPSAEARAPIHMRSKLMQSAHTQPSVFEYGISVDRIWRTMHTFHWT